MSQKSTHAPSHPSKAKQTVILPHTNHYLEVIGAREHYLKNINVRLPHRQLIVLTGVSGSGKSSLAFDTIYAEGHRRHMETLETSYVSNFIDSLERPNVDKIHGLPSVIGIKQETGSQRTLRSTIGTTTEIYAFLRLLFARTAIAYSYLTGKKMIKQSDEQIEALLIKKNAGQKIILLAPLIKGRKGNYQALFNQLHEKKFTKVRLNGTIVNITPGMQVDRYKNHDIELVIDELVVNVKDTTPLRKALHLAMHYGKGTIMTQGEKDTKLHYYSKHLMDPTTGLAYEEPSPNTFSFNSPYGACPTCQGFGQVVYIDEEKLIPNPNLSIGEGGILPLASYTPNFSIFKNAVLILKKKGYSLTTPIKDIPAELLDKILYGNRGKNLTLQSITQKREGLLGFLVERSHRKKNLLDDYSQTKTCPSCQGARLKKEALHFFINGKNIAELSLMTLQSLYNWFEDIETHLNEKQNQIAQDLLKEIRKRLRLILEIGLHYLHLHRPLKTLSGGESQRIRLATQLGTQLMGILYILDEPSIGLHQRDNQKLIQALQSLRDIGNTILVIEHDEETMLSADYLLDIGPKAGKHGGELVAAGTPTEFLQQKSTTADFLKGEKTIAIPKKRRKGNGQTISLKACTGHSLKNIDLHLPLNQLICITGVSGSGKSTLIQHTLIPALNQHFGLLTSKPLPYKNTQGLKHINKLIVINQSSIGRTPRSNPATYTGLFNFIRTLFTSLPEAKIRGYKPGRFSFNVKGGRCETCQGAGIKLIEMDFLPSVRVLCETCKGSRYNRETLEVRYKGKSIADILDMTVEEAMKFFEKYPNIFRKLKALNDVGLGYITLGQHATTFSGGESQRIKIATELSKRDTGQTLYILDEPTTGLHFQDIQQLLKVLNQLVDKGNTVLVIEHNLDVIKVADHIIDLGPESGEAGGQIIAQGTPEQVAKHAKSHTGRFLKTILHKKLSL